MTVIDFASYLALILAIAGAADFVFRAKAKRRVTSWLLRLARRPEGGAYAGSRLFDRIFGKRLVSLRALAASLALFFCFALVSGTVLILTSPPDIAESTFTIFPNGLTNENLAIAGIVVLATLAGDLLSYAKTRFFMRTLESSPSKTNLSIFVCSDFIASVLLFAAFFSLARLAGYGIISYSLEPVTVERTSWAPELMDAYLDQLGVHKQLDGLASTQGTPRLIASIRSYARAQDAEQTRRLTETLREIDWGLSRSNDLKFVEYRPQYRCATSDDGMASYATFGLVELALAQNFSTADLDRKLPNRWAVYDRLVAKRADGTCPHVVYLERQINYRTAIGNTAILDLYLGALDLTLHDTVMNITHKFSSATTVNIFKDFRDWLSVSLGISAFSLLGTGGADTARQGISSALRRVNYVSSDAIQLPFALMMSSALGASIIFWVYLVVGMLSKIVLRLRDMLARLLPQLNARTAIFTTIAFGACLMLVTLLVLVRVAGALWHLMFV